MEVAVRGEAAWLPEIPKGKGVLCIGAIMADVVCHVPRLPERGEGVVVSRRDVHLGGCAFNSGNIVRQMGCPCFIMAPVGHGLYADYIRRGLSERGLSALEVDEPVDCGSCTCFIEPDGERTMVTSPGIERRFSSSWFKSLDVSAYALVLAAGYEIEGEGGHAILDFIEENPQLLFAYAPGPRVMGVAADELKMGRLKKLAKLWHLNDLELSQLARGHAEGFEAAGLWLAAECGAVVVATRGKEGASAFFPDGTFVSAPSEPVVPVDTVGAGDTHLGALAASLCAGAAWPEALRAANRAAAAVCQVEGGSLSDEDFERLLR